MRIFVNNHSVLGNDSETVLFNQVATFNQLLLQNVEPVAPAEQVANFKTSQSKPKLADRFRGLIGSMFDE